MDAGFMPHENEQIDRFEPLYEKMDSWCKTEDYNKILFVINEISSEERNNRIWFYYIYALNGKGKYEEVREKLAELHELFKSPADRARAYYMLGLSYDKEGKEIKALNGYRRAMEEDPENTAELSLQEICEGCQIRIQNSLKQLQEISENIFQKSMECVKEMPENQKIEIEESDFAMLLAFLPAIRSIPGIDRALGLDGLFVCYEDEDEKEIVKQWLFKTYEVYDLPSLEAAMRRDFYVGRRYEDFTSHKLGKPVFDIEKLDSNGKKTWNACKMFFENTAAQIPNGGLSAWDISEEIGLARHAHACGLISDSDLMSLAMTLADEAKSRYTSWDEYFTALILGAGFFMYSLSEFSVKEAIDFIEKMSQFLFQSNISETLWSNEEIKSIRSDTLAYERWIRAENMTISNAEKKIRDYKGHDISDKDKDFTFYLIEDEKYIYIRVPSTLDFYDFLRLAYNFGNGTTVFGLHHYMPSWDFVSVVSNAVGINGMQYMSRGAHSLLHNIKQTETSNMSLLFRNNYVSEIIFLNEFYNELKLEFADVQKHQKKFHTLISSVDTEHLKNLQNAGKGFEITVKLVN